jgi:DHA2 family multidrug resistance protein
MRQALDHLHRLGFADPQAYAVLARSLTVQAYTMASDDLFWISGWLSIAMIAVVWLARRSVSGGGAQAAAD